MTPIWPLILSVCLFLIAIVLGLIGEIRRGRNKVFKIPQPITGDENLYKRLDVVAGCLW